jgi:hypothetical protein
LSSEFLVPDFELVQCRGSSAIPIPVFDTCRPPNDVDLKDWDRITVDIERNRDGFLWEKRLPKMVFRGDDRTCSANANYFGASSKSLTDNEAVKSTECGRHKAKKIARQFPQFFDFDSIPLSMDQHEQFKYVLYLHGHCHWANRLRRLLFMGMALFKQVGLCEEFYALELQPGVHYIPVDYNLENLTAAYHWARDNEDKVLDIIENMRKYAHRFNTAQFATRYLRALLIDYAELLTYKVELRFVEHDVIEVFNTSAEDKVRLYFAEFCLLLLVLIVLAALVIWFNCRKKTVL